MDSLCNHKEAATRWADGETPSCICSTLRRHLAHPPPEGQPIVLDGDISRENQYENQDGIKKNQ